MQTLKLRFFGNGFIYHSATFPMDWWEMVLKKNRITQGVFLDHLFTEDLFLKKTILHPDTGLACGKYSDLLGKPQINSASLKEHGFIEMKQNNKNIFKGKIQSLCPDQVLFPLFNSNTEPFSEDKKEGITISAGIFNKGLVGSYSIGLEEFTNNELEFEFVSMNNEKTTGTFIHEILYKKTALKSLACDYLISGQRYWFEIH